MLFMTQSQKYIYYIYNGIFCSLEKGDPAICDNMNEPGEHYAKLNKPVTEGKILCDLTYMQNLKQMNFQKHSCLGLGGRGKNGEMLGQSVVSVVQDEQVLEI